MLQRQRFSEGNKPPRMHLEQPGKSHPIRSHALRGLHLLWNPSDWNAKDTGARRQSRRDRSPHMDRFSEGNKDFRRQQSFPKATIRSDALRVTQPKIISFHDQTHSRRLVFETSPFTRRDSENVIRPSRPLRWQGPVISGQNPTLGDVFS